MTARAELAVVVETWNLRGELEPLRRLLAALAPQLGDAELVISHTGIPRLLQDELAVFAGTAIHWLELARDAGYYDHKNLGFAASTAPVVAFLDGDCEPAPGWLATLTAPIARGAARVVAGHTSYRGELAALANQLDFPYFVHDRARGSVRNFFANNVAFARGVFAARGYPAIAPMFHGQCQVLALQLLAAGISIDYAGDAHVLHAWPDGARAWLEVRLLRGADTAALWPYVVGHYAPPAARLARSVRRAPALAILAVRGLAGTLTALRSGPRLRGLALVAGITVVDAIGCAAAPAVYRAYGVA